MLALKYDICTLAQCAGIIFSELTGVESPCNLTGWGTGSGDVNALLTNAISSKLTIESKLLTAPVIINLSTSFPTASTCEEKKILASEIDSSWTNFPDGYFKFTYEVTMADGSKHETVLHKFFSCNAKCCVDKLLFKISDESCTECDHDKADIEDFLTVYSFYKSLLNAACLSQVDKFERLLKTINKLCTLANCGCK